MLTFPDWAHRSRYILKLTQRLRLSVEHHTLPGKVDRVNTFYVSLLVRGTRSWDRHCRLRSDFHAEFGKANLYQSPQWAAVA